MTEDECRCPNTYNLHHSRPGPDGFHCECWYDGEQCCNCGAPGMTDEEKKAQGMHGDTETSSPIRSMDS